MSGSSHRFWNVPIKARNAKPDDLCAFAEGLPAVCITKDQGVNNERARQRLSIQKTTDHMMRFPTTANSIWMSIEAGLACDSQTACITKQKEVSESPSKALTDALPAVKSTFGQVMAHSKASVMASMPDGPSRNILDLMHDKDAHSVPDAFGCAFEVCDGDKIPKEVREDPSVFTHALRLRLRDIGFNFGEWFNDCVDAEGNVDWAKRPMYRCTFDESNVYSLLNS